MRKDAQAPIGRFYLVFVTLCTCAVKNQVIIYFHLSRSNCSRGKNHFIDWLFYIMQKCTKLMKNPTYNVNILLKLKTNYFCTYNLNINSISIINLRKKYSSVKNSYDFTLLTFAQWFNVCHSRRMWKWYWITLNIKSWG